MGASDWRRFVEVPGLISRGCLGVLWILVRREGDGSTAGLSFPLTQLNFLCNIIHFMTPDVSVPQNGYTNLLNIWNTTKAIDKTKGDSLANLTYGFWHAGNTLDTFLDYYVRAKPEGYQKEAVARTEEGIKVFSDAVDVDPTGNPPSKLPTKAWWDDYGWWGVAFLKAYRLTNAGRYLQCVKNCWDFMDQGGRHQGDQPFEQDGTWNHYPGGAQNLITNSLFLNLSAQLYGLTKEQKYLDGANAQFQWFYHWFTKGALTPVLPGGKLVYPSCGLGVSVNDKSVPKDKGHYWTGDQGAVIGALSELLQIAGNVAPFKDDPADLASYLKDACNAIVLAVTSNDHMVYKDTGILYEPEWIDPNGAVGKGVLMRYLGAWLQSQGTLNSRKGFIIANALKATTTPAGEEYFPFSWAIPGVEISGGGYDLIKQLTQQCAGQDAYNAYLLVA